MINFHAGSLVVRIVADATRFHSGIAGASSGLGIFSAAVGKSAAGLHSQLIPSVSAAIYNVVSLTKSIFSAGMALMTPWRWNAGSLLLNTAMAIPKTMDFAIASVYRLQMAVMSLGKTLTFALTAPLAIFGVMSVKAWADFDKAMINATAAAGGVGRRMREELEKTIFDIARVSITSPKDMAQAYYYLVSAGLSIQQSMASLPVLERFSVAGIMDMRRATDVIVDIQSALNMVSADATEHALNMTRLTDVITTASIQSNATIEQLAASLTNKSASAMRLFNISLEEGTAALMVYAQQGTKAEIAGERLAMVLRDLQAVNIINRSEWLHQGISVYDLTGKMLPLAEIIGQLEDRMRGMNDESKRALLIALRFPSRSISALLPLIGRSDQLSRFTDELTRNAAGATERVAREMLQSFSAQTSIFWNHVVMAAIEAGRQLAPIIAKINNMLKGMAEYWLALNPAIRNGLMGFLFVAALVGPVMLLLGLILMLGAALVTFLINPLAWLAVIGMGLLVRNTESLSKLWDSATTNFGTFISEAGKYLYNFKENFDILSDWVYNNWPAILRDVGVIALAGLLVVLHKIWLGFRVIGEGIGANWKEIINGLVNGTMIFSRNLLANLITLTPAIMRLTTEWGGQFALIVGNLVALTMHMTQRMTANMVTLIVYIVQFLGEAITRLSPLIITVFANMGVNLRRFLINSANDITRAFNPVAGLALPANLPYVDLLSGIDLDKVGRQVRQTWVRIWDGGRGFQNVIADNFQFPFAVNLARGWNNFVAEVQAQWPNLVGLFDGFDFNFGDPANWLAAWNRAVHDFTHSGTFREFVNMLGGLGTLMPNLNNRIPTRVEELGSHTGMLGMLSNPMGGLAGMGNASAFGNFGIGRNAIGAISGLGVGSQGTGMAGLNAATLALVNGMSQVGSRGGARAFPEVSNMSGSQFEQVSTRRFELDGPYGLANTPKGGMHVRDPEAHRLLDNIRQEINPGLGN
jgi:TP901 family phage tail tape measure protein